MRRLARDLAGAQRAAVYGRTGSCLGQCGTLVSFLLDALNAVTGNLDVPGGAIFGTGPIQLEELLHRIGADSYDTFRSRIGNLPEILGTLPATVMAEEITTPGPGQIRALFVSSGNPLLSIPNGPELERAMRELDLMVAIDLYVNETSRHADYILPGTTFLERDDFPLAFLTFSLTPFVQWTEPVVTPRGEARQEWEIIDEISRRIGVTPAILPVLRALGRVGIRLSPQRLVDLLLRTRAARRPVRPAPRRPEPREAAPESPRDPPRRAPADRRAPQEGLPSRQAGPPRFPADRRGGALAGPRGRCGSTIQRSRCG